MTFLQAIVVLVIILCVNLLINRIATVALTFTGMSREMARFQARSAFCTVGFTTTEAESVVTHAVRRRIIMLLMLAGNVGFVSIIVTAVSSFGGESEVPTIGKLLMLAGALGSLWLIGSSKWVDDLLFNVISWALKRIAKLEAYDYHALLHLQEGYYITTIDVNEDDWLVGRTLAELRLADIGVNVLGIRRASGGFVGAPVGGAYIRKQDTLIVYGVRESIDRLNRQRGNQDGWEKHQQIIAAKQAHTQSMDQTVTALSISEINVDDNSWMIGLDLGALRMNGDGVAVFGVEHGDGDNLSSPPDSYTIQSGDRLFCYGEHERLQALKTADGIEHFRKAMKSNGTKRAQVRVAPDVG